MARTFYFSGYWHGLKIDLRALERKENFIAILTCSGKEVYAPYYHGQFYL